MRLSLEKTWTECLKMSSYIDRERKKGRYSIGDLKDKWIRKYYPQKYICNDCFFCAFTLGKSTFGHRHVHCDKYPGRLIDKDFDCMSMEYHYARKPHKFYLKLKQLNRLRKLNRKLITKD